VEKYILKCRSFTSLFPIPNLLLNLKQKTCLLAVAFLLLLLLSAPVFAAVEGVLTKESDGSYHQYCYQDLIDSRVNSYLGNPDGLYEDFIDKWPVALIDSVNGYIDIDYVINQYVSLLLQGQSASIDEISEQPDVKRAEMPASFHLVTIDAGKVVRQEKRFGEEVISDKEEDFSERDIGDDADEGSGTDQETPSKDDHQKSDSAEEDKGEKYNRDDKNDSSKTLIVSGPTITLSQAQAWAKSKNAHQRFVDIAPLYWEYGKKTGIRPEVLYAQAAYETGYGRYIGIVPASFNNWAGIKIGGSNGDSPEDYEQFATPEEGVRGHFNHISAYVGLQPVGKPHDRYHSVKSMPWAGTVEYFEELSGKWAHSSIYHETIVRMICEMK